jgi:transcriptional regulator with GAF, ATPase, and Fis domain
VAATNRDLEKRVREGTFRQDLYYRLNVFPIRVPPLRERMDDVPLLVQSFVQEFSRTMKKVIDAVPQTALDSLLRHDWPGNIRELRNVIERAMIVTQGDVLALDVPRGRQGEPLTAPASTKLDDVERSHILEVLEQTGWRISGPRGAAAALGVKPTTLEYRMTKLGITRPGHSQS